MDNEDFLKTCCPCDERIYPAQPNIPAGLNTLPRQLTDFSESRLAMLQAIPQYSSLAKWSAREGNDLGIMLLEMWAYVLDILSFYDERIANETYIRTAIRSASLYKLVRLIGYYPRPALGASVVLAAIADGKKPVILPPRTGFRSDAFGDEPPQIFETEIEQNIHPFLNQWTLAEVTEPLSLGNELLLELDTAAVSIGQIVLLRGGTLLHVGRVTLLKTINALDGNSYLAVNLEPAPTLAPDFPLENIEVLSPTLTAFPSLLKKYEPAKRTGSGQPTNSSNVGKGIQNRNLEIQAERSFDNELSRQSENKLILFKDEEIPLDNIYPQFTENDLVIIQIGNQFLAFPIIKINRPELLVSQANDSPTIPVTEIVIRTLFNFNLLDDPSRLIVHFELKNVGTLTRTRKTHINQTDFEPSGIAIEGIVEPLPENVSTSGKLLFQDANDQGVLVNGNVFINNQGEGNVLIASDTTPFNPSLRTPITVFGNLIRVSRGESVIDEVLGNGDPSQAFQSFSLQNNPLTYFNDPSTPTGRRSTLVIRVNGILWQEVQSFFGTKPQDQVYIVRQNEQQATTVTFGDGISGARLPSGIGNITATYRFGAGAAKPPTGTISQLVNPVEGLRRAINPVAAGGGADGDRPKDIRNNAPETALLLGRAISVPDFEALTREFGGVINARVEWAWDETSQNTVVKVWFISDGGDIKKELKTHLEKHSDPNTPFVITEAIAQPSMLTIEVTLDPRFTPQTVVDQIRQTLTNPETGLLALINIPIGFPLFRSQIFASILAVEGTCAVSSMSFNGHPAPFAITVPEGYYCNFLSSLIITSSPAKSEHLITKHLREVK